MDVRARSAPVRREVVAAPASGAAAEAGAADTRRRLVDAAGNVRLGIFTEAVHEINYRDFRLTDAFDRPVGRLRRHFAFKQFQFLGILSETLVCGCAIADLKYVGTAFAYCYEPATRRLSEHSFVRPLGLGVLCFTTGRGSAYGCKPTPSIKLATNSAIYQQMIDDMDINCGDILDGVSIEAKGEEIFRHVLRVASGEKSKSELLGYGDAEFVPWQLGATM